MSSERAYARDGSTGPGESEAREAPSMYGCDMGFLGYVDRLDDLDHLDSLKSKTARAQIT